MRKIVAAVAIAAALQLATVVANSTAHADPGDQCMPPVWIRHGWIPGTQQTCWHADGSYTTCTSMGTTGDGPGACYTFPGAPAPTPGNKLQIGGPPPQ